MTLRRILILLPLFLIVLLVIVGAVVITNWTRGPLPLHDGELAVAGLQDTVEIVRDEWGIPHIYASNTYDLFFAQGFTQAQDRWWQMEFYRATGDGRLQELTGQNDSLMRSDIFIRTVGWRQAAERDFEAYSDDAKAVLQAFTDGVNAYIESRPTSQLAMEYNILGITGVNIPLRPWTPIDTLVWGKVMAWDLSGNRSEELIFDKLYNEFSEDFVLDIAPLFPFEDKPTIIFPEDLPLSEDTLAVLESDTAAVPVGETQFAGNIAPNRRFIFGEGSGIGSNNWVVHGSKTASGMPLLANDPHLGFQMPSIWYEIGLHCRPVSDECPYEVVGFTFSPTPGVVIGHNARIAWAVTNVGWDTQDLYRIKVNPENPLQYEWNGEWRDMTVREEVIRFGDSDETVTIQVRETHLGPIINDNELDENGQPMGFNNENPLAFRWTAYEPGTVFEAVMRLNRASNWEEFREALRYWDTPAQNVIYADVEGNIGYQTPGNVPIRANGHTGVLPVDGTTDAYEWLGYVPFDELPRIFNPERGYIATANQALVPPEYYEQLAENLADQFGEDANYVFDLYWDYGYRGERIVELLEAEDAHTIATMQAIQGDNKIISAEELLPLIADIDFGDEQLNAMRDWLLDWDYQMHMDSPRAAFYAYFWVALLDNTFTDQYKDIIEISGTTREMWAMYLLSQEPEHVLWDDVNTDVVETRDDILVRAFREAYDNAVAALGGNRDDWRWGDIHTTAFTSNPLGLSGIGLIENMVNRGPVATSGSTATVNAANWDAAEGFFVNSGASMRMIVDLGDFDNSLAINTTGQSGHPFSEHYGDMIDMWRNIEYHPMLWSAEPIEAAASARLVLKPTE